MSNELRFDGKVAIVTGAGNGLGKSHALLLASRGAKVVVNDLGGGATGGGKSSAAADAVVAEIKKNGGEAVANYDSVEDGAKIVQCALDSFKGLHIVVNNAGILRDTSFQKMSQEDWDLIYRVHVLGGFRVTHAAWNHLRDQGYGRIVFTASAAGIYGNFGQANYAMAKLGLVGLSNTLALEGKKKGVFVNTIAPIAGSRLTETVLPKDLIDALKPEFVSPLLAYLCHESCEETGGLFEVGGGFMGKLRWERAEGQTFKLNKAISPEMVRDKFSLITGFEKTTHPTDITASMQPIMNNLGTAKEKSHGGNEFIDVDAALGYEFEPIKGGWTERDVSLYALGVGAAKNPLDESDLKLVYEMSSSGFQVLPTFAVAPVLKSIFDMAKEGKQAPGLKYGFDRVLHGEQYTEVKRPLPPNAKVTHHAKVKDIFDKGKNALVVTAVTTKDENGQELAYNEITTFVRGAGGWGGDRGPQGEANVPPERAPDQVIEEKTDPNQALLYRLSGDWNPLHVDPSFATAFGFKQPILHGLCTFGFAARHVIKAFSKGDPRYFKSIKVRFADSVFPGETIVTEMWKESDTKIVFRSKVKERDKVVISNAAVELYKEIPTGASAKPAAAAAPAAAPATIGSKEVFKGIGWYVGQHPELVAQVGNVFQWKLKNPDASWVFDLKNGKGEVREGTAEKPDCTLELAESDFMDMTSGKADPMKLYMGGKLKISGNVMASQKLQFLQKVDKDAVAKALGVSGGAAPAASAAPAPASGGSASDMVFKGVGWWVSQHPELVQQIATTYQWKLKNPDSEWVFDLKNGKGEVKKGTIDKADCTLELADSDFIDMTTGKADPMKLYMGGKLKISGNVMASQKLQFLQKIDKDAVAKALGSQAAAPAAKAAPAAPAAAAPAAARASSVFGALKDRLAKNPALAKEVGAALVFKVGDKTWTIDLTSAGAVKEGSDPSAVTVLTIADEDLVELVKDPGCAKDLYQRGKLRVDGDVRFAHKLSFLKDLA